MKKKLLWFLIILAVIFTVGYFAFQWYLDSINMKTSQEAPKTVSTGEQEKTETGVSINKIDHLKGKYAVILEKSSLFFEVGGTTAASGKFTEFDLTFELDSSEKSLDVVIQTKSINTTNSMRDEHLREADFFDVAKYPTITFKSSSITTGDTSLIATGTVNFLGKDYDLTIPFKYIGAVKDAENTEYFEGKFEFDRVKMGMKEDATIDNVVTVKFFCELKKN
jgi:polyisoprenoid-binding protein YceI